MAWLNREPRGDARDDYRHGLQTAFLRSCWIDGGREDPNDFVLRFEPANRLEETNPEAAKLIDEIFSMPAAMSGFFKW